MRVFSRIGMVSVMSVAGLFGSAGAGAPVQPAGSAHCLSSPAGDRQFHLSDAAGRFLALHFLTATDNPHCTALVREYLAAAAGAAGVVHVFVMADDPAAVKAWGAQFGSDASSVYLDPGGLMAKDLGIPGGLAAGGATSNSPATVVFGPDGKELFRHVGASSDDHLEFGSFVQRLTQKSRWPALAEYNFPKDKAVAVEGYDVVAYFTQSRGAKGLPSLASVYRGVTYHFASESHRRLFAADPEKYLPTYGGWCASAMGDKGTKVEISPTNFKVKDGRLFLFYKSLWGDALKDWNKHEREWEPAADANWKRLTGEDPIRPSK